MPTYKITAPDGKVLRINAPEGATQEQVLAYAQANYATQPQETRQQRYDRIHAELELRNGTGGIDPTEGMSAWEKTMAGAGRSVAETWRGLKQVGGAIADQIPGVDLSDFRRRTQAEIDWNRQLDAPLMNTGWGQFGNVLGTAAQLYTPGTALKGTAAARYLLPTTIRGNALQGAVLGTLQPTATGESRVGNTLAGGAAGGAGAAAMKGVTAGYRAARNALAGAGGVSSAERAAAERLLAEAENPASLLQAAPSLVPGVLRDLAEESRDAGIARLTQTLRGQPGFNWGARDSANNVARTNVLERIAGTDSDMAAAEAARSQATSTARQQAMQAGDVDISRVVAQVDDAIDAAQGRPAVQAGLRQLRGLLARDVEYTPGVVTTEPEARIAVLDNVRKTIGDMLGGKYGGDNAAALAGSRELIGIRDAMNREIGDQVPAFTDYLDAYRQGSLPINRMEIGRELLRRATQNIQTDAVGNRMLGAKPLANAIRDLDTIAPRATGFSKAKGADIMPASDIAMLKALQDDAERQVIARTAGTGGNSASAARAGVLSRMGSRAGNAVAAVVPYGQHVKSLLQTLDEKGQQRIAERLAYLVANPAEARRVLAALPPAGQQIVSKALTQIAGMGGAAAGVTAATQDQPLEINVSGGTPGPAPTEEELEALRGRARANAAAAGSY